MGYSKFYKITNFRYDTTINNYIKLSLKGFPILCYTYSFQLSCKVYRPGQVELLINKSYTTALLFCGT